MNKIIYFLAILAFSSCISEPKKKKIVKKNSNKTVTTSKSRNLKQKVGNSNTYKKALKRTKKYAYTLKFDLDYIRKKGLPDKKHLAEYLGLFLKLKKASTSEAEKQEIIAKVKPLYDKIQEPAFHNMAEVSDKLFKKNSMSYMRIMWLLKELNFDISAYKKEFDKIKKRMDAHMKVRGEWQRAVFEKYYNFFKLKKPIELKYAKKLKGPIAYQKPLEFYDRTQSYILTHFIFAAYDYGNKTTQNRFSKSDLDYLAEILPKIIQKFELKNDDDLVGELLTCLVLIGKTEAPSFKQSYRRLLYRQNIDGSFGLYERGRKKFGNDIEFRYYLHTTLVDMELFIEKNYRENKK